MKILYFYVFSYGHSFENHNKQIVSSKLYLASIYWFNEIIAGSLINSGKHVHHYTYQPDAKNRMNGVNC